MAKFASLGVRVERCYITLQPFEVTAEAIAKKGEPCRRLPELVEQCAF
jgi:hypothetical protein